MAKPNLSRMDFESLVKLREQVDEELVSRRATMEKQLAALGGSIVSGRGNSLKGSERGSALKGKKVPPKYRDRSGNTWAGRGAKPRWLVAAIKEGKKLEDFAIGKTARKRRSKKK